MAGNARNSETIIPIPQRQTAIIRYRVTRYPGLLLDCKCDSLCDQTDSDIDNVVDFASPRPAPPAAPPRRAAPAPPPRRAPPPLDWAAAGPQPISHRIASHRIGATGKYPLRH